MAYKNRTPNLPRFRVERIGDQFVILDSVAVKYDLFASRLEAEQVCAARNGTAPGRKSTEPTISRQFREKGVTVEEIDAFYDACDRADAPRLWEMRRSAGAVFHSVDGCEYRVRVRGETEAPPRPAPVAGKSVEVYKNWLPPLLRDWAEQIATHFGYGGTKRGSWRTYRVINAIRADGWDNFAFENAASSELHCEVWQPYAPLTQAQIELRRVLAVHYLAADPDHIKARYFGVSERTYRRQVDAAHRSLALRFGSGNYAYCAREDYDDSPREDDDGWYLDAADRANLNWTK
jgi:hypothetical protein